MDYLLNSRIFKTQQRVSFALSQPYECRPIIKKFYQCVDYFESKKGNSTEAAEESCAEYSFNECILENSKKTFENRIFNFNIVKPKDEEEE
jgi:hypothetical protein